jgi:hypothetical protein
VIVLTVTNICVNTGEWRGSVKRKSYDLVSAETGERSSKYGIKDQVAFAEEYRI